MRTLLGLTTLMLVLAAAVWWKTRAADDPTNLPPKSTQNASEGVVTLGMKPEGSKETRHARLGGGKFEEASSQVQPIRTGPADWSASSGDEFSPAGGREATPGGEAKPTSGPEQTPAAKPKPNPPPPAAQGMDYRVAEGDTFYRIVLRHYGTAPEALIEAVARANGLRDPSQLAVGQDLKLPVVDGFSAPKRP